MKKKNIKNLMLNKKVISNFDKEEIIGGTGRSVNQSCTGMASCANCTIDCHTHPYESVYYACQ